MDTPRWDCGRVIGVVGRTPLVSDSDSNSFPDENSG